MSILGYLGIAVCCGLPLLIFAAVVFYAARKHTRNMAQINSAAPARISTLKAGSQLVRLEGIIKQVHQPIDGPADSPLAFVRLKVEVYERDSDGSGWRGTGDKLRASPFLLEDESGAIWVDPQGLDKLSLGEGIVPSREAAEAAAILTGINPVLLNTDYRAQLWELRGGQRVTVIGAVTQRNGALVVSKLKNNPLLITPLLGEAVQLPSQQQARTGWMWSVILGIPGLLAFCCGIVSAAVVLLRTLQQ
jgi:hypothetical protein